MNTYIPLPLKQLPLWETPPEAVQDLYQSALAGFSRKIIVLDDDPTGIQTVHGVHVYTDWSYEHILDCFRDDAVISYILTNSRSSRLNIQSVYIGKLQKTSAARRRKQDATLF